MPPRHFAQHSWKLKSLRTTLRLEWTWRCYAIDQIKRYSLLEAARHGGKADFILKSNQRREVLEWIQALMFPDGYAGNLRRGVNLGTLRVNGMKSHDYHIWIE
jgi:hypothetical protein